MEKISISIIKQKKMHGESAEENFEKLNKTNEKIKILVLDMLRRKAFEDTKNGKVSSLDLRTWKSGICQLRISKIEKGRVLRFVKDQAKTLRLNFNWQFQG